MKHRKNQSLTAEETARLRGMTMEELLAELDAKAEAAGGLLEEDVIRAYLDALDEKAPVLPEFDPKASFADFRETHSELLRRNDECVPRRPVCRRRSKVLRTVAIAAILSALMLSAAFATEITQALHAIADGVFSFENVQAEPQSGRMDLPEPQKDGYSSLEEALSDYDLGALVPTWIPSRFAATDIMLKTSELVSKFYGSYGAEDQELEISVTYHEDVPAVTAFELNEDDEPELYPVNGVDYYIARNAERVCVIWQTADCTCRIAGDITREEARQMVDSIGAK